MTEITELLGSTGVVPAGDYSPEKTYDFLNMVYAAPSVYVSRKGDNTGHPVTDTDWWMLSIDGSKNPEAVKAALDAAPQLSKPPLRPPPLWSMSRVRMSRSTSKAITNTSAGS